MPSLPVTFPTGRSRTLTYAKTFTGSAATGLIGNDHFFTNGVFLTNCVSSLNWTFGIDVLRQTYTFQTSAAPQYRSFNPVYQGGDWDLMTNAVVLDPAGNRADAEHDLGASVLWVGPGSTNPADWTALTIAFTGSFQIQVAVQEWCTVYAVETRDPSAVIISDGRAFPDYSTEFPGFCPGGFPDGIQATGCQFFERIVAGTSVTASATCNGVTASLSWSAPSDLTVLYPAESDDQALVAPCVSYLSQSASITSQTQFNGFSLSGTESHDGSGNGVSGHADNIGGHNVSVSSNGPTAASVMDEIAALPASYSANLRLRAFNNPGPGLTFDIRTAPGVRLNTPAILAASFQQQQSQGQWVAGPASGSLATLAQLSPVRVWLDEPSLVASGDDLSDWRCQIRGKPFPCFSIAQASTLPVFSGQTVTGSSAPITPTETNWEGYRTLSFTIDQSGSLTLATPQGLTKSWSWKVPTPGTAATITLDLCSPHGWNQNGSTLPLSDARDSRYPLAASGEPDEIGQPVASMGVYWGVFAVSQLTFSGFASAILGPGNLIRAKPASATILAPFAKLFVQQIGNPVEIQPILTLESDGKCVADWPCLQHNPGVNWADFSLHDVAVHVATIPGWSATEATSFPDSTWHTNAGPASWLFGGGAVWQPSSGWADAIDCPLGSWLAQPLYDEVTGYPGIGDAWNGTAYPQPNDDPALPLPVTKFVRGRAWGVCLNGTTRLPMAGAKVNATEVSGGLSAGSGTAASTGYFVTGPLFGRGPRSISTALQSSISVVTAPWANRHSQRAGLVGQPNPATDPALLETPQGELGFAFIDADGNVNVHFSPSAGPAWVANLPSVVVTSGGNWSLPKLAIDSRRTLHLRAFQGTSGYSLFSYDLGQTWSNPVALPMNATACDLRCNPSGTLLEISFVPDSGTSGPGGLVFRLRRIADAAFSAAVACVDSSGNPLRSDGTGYGFDAAHELADRWFLTFTTTGDSAPSFWYSADDGATWSRLSG